MKIEIAILIWILFGIAGHWIIANKFDRRWMPKGYRSIKKDISFWFMFIFAILAGPGVFIGLLILEDDQ